jgi:hypothetical protein
MIDPANIKRQFLHSLKRGTGEAYLIAKRNPKIDFSNQIIKGVLNIYAYDPQCEGDRAKYIFDIISISKQKDKIRKAVLKGLATEQNDTWNLTHLFALAKLYAQQNDTEVKEAIYERFLNNPIKGSDWIGAYEILHLDGLHGLFYVADKFGKYIEQNPDNWQDDWIIRRFQEERKSIKVAEELKKKAKTNKFIRIYLDNIKRTITNQEKHKTKPSKHKDVIDEVLNSKPRISFVRKRGLTETEVNKIARHLIIETDQSAIEKLLNIFDFHKFPYDSEIILKFANQKRTGKNRIVENAIKALKYLEGKDVRNFALDRIQNSKSPMEYLNILVSNYKSGDFKILSEIAAKTNNEHKIEQLAGIYTDIFTANKTKYCKQPLEILYSKMNCAIHRKGIVEILKDNKVLSNKIKQEIKFDCDLETRKLAK